METSSHLDGTIFPVFPTAGNTFENPSPRPSFTFFPARKRISYSRARIYRFRIIKFKIEKGETQFV